MRNFFIFLMLVPLSFHVKAQLLIKNTTVIDVENKKLLPGIDVLIEKDIIKKIGRSLKVPSGTKTVDGTGKYLSPGFVDAHVHFFQSGGIFTRPDQLDLRKVKPYADEIAWTHNNMENTLRRYSRAGITTVVDVGSTINFLLERDRFRLSTFSPSIYMTGPLLVTFDFPGYENLGNDNPFYFMKTVEDAYRYIDNELPYKPDFIKIGFVVPGKNKDSVARSYMPRIRAVIQKAHSLGLRVAVHAFEQTTAQLAVEAGADHLVHIPFDKLLDADFIKILKDKKTVISSSTTVFEGYRKTIGQYYHPNKNDSLHGHPDPIQTLLQFKNLPDTALTERLRKATIQGISTSRKNDSTLLVNLKKLVDAGIPVATSTDAGNIGTPHVSSYFNELLFMQQGGLNLWDLLQSSTINGARAIGKENKFGSISIGKRADLLLFSKNPLESLDNWKHIDLVILRGVEWKTADLMRQ
jgi:imidazolonepropionase-like amidohydrolase